MQRADGVQPGRRGLREVVAKGGGTGAEESYGAEEHEGAEAHSTIAPPVFRRRACSGQTRSSSASVTDEDLLQTCDSEASFVVLLQESLVAGDGVKL